LGGDDTQKRATRNDVALAVPTFSELGGLITLELIAEIGTSSVLKIRIEGVQKFRWLLIAIFILEPIAAAIVDVPIG